MRYINPHLIWFDLNWTDAVDVSAEDIGNYTCEVHGLNNTLLASVTHSLLVAGFHPPTSLVVCLSVCLSLFLSHCVCVNVSSVCVCPPPASVILTPCSRQTLEWTLRDITINRFEFSGVKNIAKSFRGWGATFLLTLYMFWLLYVFVVAL